MQELKLLAAEVGGFGGRDVAALLFLALAILGIWIAFRHLQDFTESPPTKPPEPPPGSEPK